MNPYLAEFLGTLVLILLGDGVCACNALNKSKGQGAGWVAIIIGWGLAVMAGVFVAGPSSGAHLNPAVSLALALTGSLPWAMVPDPDTKLGTFCTMPAIKNTWRNFFCEFVGTWLLVFCILMFATEGNVAGVSLGSSGAFPVTMLIMAIGVSLGGATGYAINPARDLGPRIAHAVLPIKGKRDSGWWYSWIPVAGPLAGAAFAAGMFLLIF